MHSTAPTTPRPVRLFTEALRSGGLSPSDRELALVKRAQAYIGEMRNDLALGDLQQALKLDPNDAEAASLRLQASESGLHIRTAGDLAELCDSNPNAAGGEMRISFCHGYAQGVVTASLANAGAARPFCFPSPAPSRVATLGEFVKWARASATYRGGAAADGLMEFLTERYPCK